MRVLLLTDCLDNGGLERQMALLATRLPDDCPRRVWTMDEGPFLPYLLERGVPVTIVKRNRRFDPRPAAALWRQLQAWRPDVVHAWSWMAALAAAPACRSLGIPFVDGFIQTGGLEPDFRSLKRLGMALSTLVVANTQSGLDAWGVGAAKGRVVPNGFDASRVPAKGAVTRTDQRFTVVMTGRMKPVKHYDVVIAAARRLSHQDGWRFVLVGDGSDRSRLQDEAADLVAAGVVEFPEPDFEVLNLVAASDVGVLMTNPALAFEGLSNSLLEYMALGLPTVCGDGGGNRELVRDGVTGFIIPPADPGALADRLHYLREHEDKRLAMGAASRSRALNDFSVEKMLARMLAVYQEAITAWPRRTIERRSR